MAINVIGAGLAGLSAASTLAETGVFVNLISLKSPYRAQSVLAEGGINAALDTMGEGDAPAEHFADTIRGGVFLSDPDAVRGLTDNAPHIVEKLLEMGTALNTKDGKAVLRNFGGQKKKRTAFSKSSTGKIIMTGLTDLARKYEAEGLIKTFFHHQVTHIDIQDKKCKGVRFFDVYTNKEYYSPGPVILAIGGYNGIFPEMTTGTVYNTGDLLADLFDEGLVLSNLEFIQYHPTTVGIPGKRLLISEAARGEGGRLFIYKDGTPWYFMEELYPDLKNLSPRDVISREMTKAVSRDDTGDTVYLDLTGISPDTWKGKLSDLREEVFYYMDLDPVKDHIPVTPGIHFFMGGIYVDKDHRTSAEGLYAAGECASQYHGANRLGGNSMLGAIYGGSVAAGAAIRDAVMEKDIKTDPEETGIVGKEFLSERKVNADTAFLIRDILLSGLGIIRNKEDMEEALGRLSELFQREDLTGAEKKRIQLGRAMLLCALLRKESRGAHFRTEHPERNDEDFRKTTVARITDGSIDISFEDIKEVML